MSNFRIYNFPLPTSPQQPATKNYVDQKDTQQDIAINSKAERDEVLLLDGSKSMMGNLQMGSKRITDLGDGSDDGDAVNFSQLLSHTTDHKRDYQLASSPNFYREFGDKGALTKSRWQISGHLHLDLYDVGGIEGIDNGFGGEAWSSLRMTSTLGRGIYTVVFETFSVGPLSGSSGASTVILNDETLLYSVHGDSHFQIITFNHDWESDSGGNTPHSKAYIQFSSDGQPGEIKFQFRYYGRYYNRSSLGFLFYSRVLRGKHTNTFDHQLFDVKETESGNAFLFFENIKMNDNRIFGLPQPTGPQQPATKKYVDDNALLLSGGDMTGSFSMQGNRIYSLPIPTGSQQPATKEYTKKSFIRKISNESKDYNADSKKLVNLADPINDTDAANKRYVLGQVGNVDLTAYLRRDGTQSMTGNLQMGSKKITDLAYGISDGDAVNYSQLIFHTTDHKRDYQLVSSFIFYRDFGDKGALTKSSLVISGHQHLDLYFVGIEGRDSGSGGEAWSSPRMTNTLERGIYTVVFETFSLAFTGIISQISDNHILNDETLLYSVHGDDHFQIRNFGHDWESDSGGSTPHSKAYIQFSSDG